MPGQYFSEAKWSTTYITDDPFNQHLERGHKWVKGHQKRLY